MKNKFSNKKGVQKTELFDFEQLNFKSVSISANVVNYTLLLFRHKEIILYKLPHR
jgi:hypothetical protein